MKLKKLNEILLEDKVILYKDKVEVYSYKEINEVGENEISLKEIKIIGNQLSIVSMDSHKLVVTGNINEIKRLEK